MFDVKVVRSHRARLGWLEVLSGWVVIVTMFQQASCVHAPAVVVDRGGSMVGIAWDRLGIFQCIGSCSRAGCGGGCAEVWFLMLPPNVRELGDLYFMYLLTSSTRHPTPPPNGWLTSMKRQSLMSQTSGTWSVWSPDREHSWDLGKFGFANWLRNCIQIWPETESQSNCSLCSLQHANISCPAVLWPEISMYLLGDVMSPERKIGWLVSILHTSGLARVLNWTFEHQVICRVVCCICTHVIASCTMYRTQATTFKGNYLSLPHWVWSCVEGNSHTQMNTFAPVQVD